jgi:hypothetical protein
VIDPRDDDHYRACRKLITSVLLDAICDWRADLGRRMHSEERAEEMEILKESARKWIFDQAGHWDVGSLTFEACCEHLDLNAVDVRERLARD